MSAITYGAAAPHKTVAKRKGLFTQFIEAVQAGRMRQAQREVARYRHLMPEEFERAAARLDARSEQSLPFMR